tara:strand:+ start:320 stop:637 length:318 start_codon:yes stop_codon:yes gene_type:complete
MNKLYAFFALVLLTACGSPYDGSWKGVDEFVDYKIEISGDEAKFIVLNNPMSSNNITCTVSRGDDKAKMICEDDEGNTSISDLKLDGDIMTIKPEGRREATFVKD